MIATEIQYELTGQAVSQNDDDHTMGCVDAAYQLFVNCFDVVNSADWFAIDLQENVIA